MVFIVHPCSAFFCSARWRHYIVSHYELWVVYLFIYAICLRWCAVGICTFLPVIALPSGDVFYFCFLLFIGRGLNTVVGFKWQVIDLIHVDGMSILSLLKLIFVVSVWLVKGSRDTTAHLLLTAFLPLSFLRLLLLWKRTVWQRFITGQMSFLFPMSKHCRKHKIMTHSSGPVASYLIHHSTPDRRDVVTFTPVPTPVTLDKEWHCIGQIVFILLWRPQELHDTFVFITFFRLHVHNISMNSCIFAMSNVHV